MRTTMTAILLALAIASATASTEASFSDMAGAVSEACSTASGLNNVHVSGLVWFDDSLNKVALLVTGTHPQEFMKGAQGEVLCIYDKLSGQVWTDEATGWSAPAQK